jgi:hypothetical protein
MGLLFALLTYAVFGPPFLLCAWWGSKLTRPIHRSAKAPGGLAERPRPEPDNATYRAPASRALDLWGLLPSYPIRAMPGGSDPDARRHVTGPAASSERSWTRNGRPGLARTERGP